MKRPGQEEGGTGEDILKAQVYQTVEEHLKKELRFKGKGIKVLSLFFVDRVSNYRGYDENGNLQKGKIALWIEEALTEYVKKPLYQGLLTHPVEKLHDGYFAEDRKREGRKKGDVNSEAKCEELTYHLIMRDKETLLSCDEPLRFIFSHSALKEGWDNPNVFQICSLREMGTERERRQTLGRGLRLPVNQQGERIYDESINRLTVIAGETFQEYAKGLQEDVENDCKIKFGRIEKIAFAALVDDKENKPLGQEASGFIWQALVEKRYLNNAGDVTDRFAPEKKGFRLDLPQAYKHLRAEITDEIKKYIFKNRIVNARERKSIAYNKRIELNDDFKALWDKIGQKTRYAVEFKTQDLIHQAAIKIKNMDAINPIRILIEKTKVEITEAGIENGKVLDSKMEKIRMHHTLPDILAWLQRETELTRHTLAEILKQSGRLNDFAANPQTFMTEAAKLVNRALHELVVDGIKYEKLEGQFYEMRLFEEKGLEEYLSRLYQIQSNDNRTPYDYIPFESEGEYQVAELLDSNENVKFFCKLPRWFVVPTPLGDYHPDWAIVTERDQKLYLVRETKSTHDAYKRRDTENKKIKCGKAHFNSIDVNFKVAISIQEVLSE